MEMDLTLDLWGVENPEEELEKVRQQALTCTACRLAETRTNVVFGEGNPRAPLVFVGEDRANTKMPRVARLWDGQVRCWTRRCARTV